MCLEISTCLFNKDLLVLFNIALLQICLLQCKYFSNGLHITRLMSAKADILLLLLFCRVQHGPYLNYIMVCTICHHMENNKNELN